MTTPFVVVPLDTERHDRKAFTCGVESLDRYLKEQASQDLRRRANAIFVLAARERPTEIIGYYTLCAIAVPDEQVPAGLRKQLRFPKNRPVSATLLGRFATAQHVQGRGLGTALLGDAIRRAHTGSLSVGSCMLVLDARNEEVADFYVKRGRFIRLADSLRCVLPMETVEQLIREEDAASAPAPQVPSEDKAPAVPAPGEAKAPPEGPAQTVKTP